MATSIRLRLTIEYPDFAKWLLEQKMDSMSLNPDTVISTWKNLSKK